MPLEELHSTTDKINYIKNIVQSGVLNNENINDFDKHSKEGLQLLILSIIDNIDGDEIFTIKEIESLLLNKETPNLIKIGLLNKIKKIDIFSLFEIANNYITTLGDSYIQNLIENKVKQINFFELEKIIEKGIEKLGAFKIIIDKIKKYNFIDIEKILLNKKIENNIKYHIIEGCNNIDFQNIIYLITKETILGEYITITLIKKIKTIKLEDIQEILDNNHIDISIKAELIKKIDKLQLSEIKENIIVRKYDYRISGEIISKIDKINLDEALYLLEQNISKYEKLELIDKIKQFSINAELINIYDLYKPYKINDNELKLKLISKGRYDLKNIKKIILNPLVIQSQKKELIKNLNPIKFSEYIELLNTGNLNYLESLYLLEKITIVSFKDIKSIILNESFPYTLNSILIKKLNNITYKEIEFLIKIKNIKLPVLESSIKQIDILNYSEGIYLINLINENFNGNKKEIIRKILNKIGYNINISNYFKGLDKKENLSKQVNKMQARKITDYHISDEYISNKRALVFYYREKQGSYYNHYNMMIQLLDQYINGGFSSVWNEFKVITRWGFLKKVGNINTNYETGLNFKKSISIYADSINLNHGTLENTKGTYAIAGKALYSDKSKVIGKNHIKSSLLYYGGENTDRVKGNTKDNGIGIPLENLEDICKNLLDDIIKLEEKIIHDLNQSPENIVSETTEYVINTIN